jgi:hypothetical protein
VEDPLSVIERSERWLVRAMMLTGVTLTTMPTCMNFKNLSVRRSRRGRSACARTLMAVFGSYPSDSLILEYRGDRKVRNPAKRLAYARGRLKEANLQPMTLLYRLREQALRCDWCQLEVTSPCLLHQ